MSGILSTAYFRSGVRNLKTIFCCQTALTEDMSTCPQLILDLMSGMGARWLSGRVLDSRPKGRGFKPHRRHCIVSLSKNINPSLVLVQPRKTRPFITERLLMGRKESNQTKQKQMMSGISNYFLLSDSLDKSHVYLSTAYLRSDVRNLETIFYCQAQP